MASEAASRSLSAVLIVALVGVSALCWQQFRRAQVTAAELRGARIALASRDGAVRAGARASSEPTRAQVVEGFRRIWATNENGLLRNKFLGISAPQNPLDVWVTQEIFFEVKPDVVVETGTFRGGSALLWASLLEPMLPDARVLTIDVEDGRSAEAIAHPLAKRRVDFLAGSSIDPAVVAEVKRRTAGKRVVVILDSDHSKEHVLAELRAYAAIVPVGSYFIVEDTLAGGLLAIREFLEEDDRFEVDKARERLILTNNRAGFLRRAR